MTRLHTTFQKIADYQRLEANDFESAEFANSPALVIPDRFYGDKSPEKLNVVFLSPARIRFYEDPKRGMIREIKGEVTGITYKVLSFHIPGGGSYMINYHRKE